MVERLHRYIGTAGLIALIIGIVSLFLATYMPSLALLYFFIATAPATTLLVYAALHRDQALAAAAIILVAYAIIILTAF